MCWDEIHCQCGETEYRSRYLEELRKEAVDFKRADMLLNEIDPRDAETSASKAVAEQKILFGLNSCMSSQSPYAALSQAQLAELWACVHFRN